MTYTTQVSTYFRTYTAILNNGIPSVLDLFQTNHSVCRRIQNDKSVRTTLELGTKVIKSISLQEDLYKSYRDTVRTLLSMDVHCSTLLFDYYCLRMSKEEAQIASGLVHRDAFTYSQALFALKHPSIEFGTSDFLEVCKEIQWSGVPQTIECIVEDYKCYKERLLEESYLGQLANELPALRNDINNSFFFETAPTDRQFFRDRNTLTVALFFQKNPTIHFYVISTIVKSEQGSKKYLKLIEQQLHSEVLFND